MIKTNLIVVAGLFLIGMSACQKENVLPKRTNETECLLNSLKRLPKTGYMFGHHDATSHGIGWDGDADRSDVKSVCGAYPAVMSFDLGRIELGNGNNLDNVPFERIKNEIISQYNRGGMSSLSWHMDNPVTGKDSWDVSDTTVVTSILPGGACHEKFTGWLDKAADFINSVVTADGVKVPILFRPWHEHTGSWFWWGQNLCSAEEYKALWKMTYEHMQKKGANNLLYAYSAGSEPNDTTEYLERYPGDDIIDLIGFDTYQFNRQDYVNTMEKSLSILTEVGKTHQKPIAVTETGFETIPDSVWWTETLMPVIDKYPITYILVWRNAREREEHYFAPYPGQASANDFVDFYHSPKTLFIGDNFTLYK